MAPRKAKRKLDDAFSASSTTSKRNARGASPRQSLRLRKAPENASEEIDELANSDEEDSSGDFEVEPILREEGGLFFVKWAGYDSEDNTWEPEDHLKPDMVMKFRQSSKRRAKLTQQDQVDSDVELEAAIELPVEAYNRFSGNELRPETWDVLCRPYLEKTEGGDIWDEFEQVGEAYARYDCQESISEDVGEVERVATMSFDPLGIVERPEKLFAHSDGVSSTNAYGAAEKRQAVTLEVLMKFLGILFYTALIDKGEYANYWGEQVEDSLIEAESARMDVMPLKRFEFIRKNVCFRYPVTLAALKRDPAAGIRPLMNMLKVRAPTFLTPGRNVAVDESSIACRSRYARHLIVFNTTKPTGKHHFKFYMCCCSESWLVINFRRYCASGERHDGVVSRNQAVH
ncbi:hypothetical protein ON010_g5216 [Phytophthora cinnamomi]|nr:hypothetical protein ON010_g5216 [Phytophthora cinnamomi]